MKLIIFEGADNIGKTTLILKLVEKYRSEKDLLLMHCTGPAKDVSDPFDYQERVCENKVIKICDISVDEKMARRYTNENVVLMDRSWLGEYVYGILYRNGDKEKIIKLFDSINKMLKYDTIECNLVYLYASSNFILNNDDNLSLFSKYESNKKLDLIEKELILFNDCLKICSDKKYFKNILSYNVEDEKTGKFKNINEILFDIEAKIKI